MFRFINGSTLNFMLSFINIGFCVILESLGAYGALNATIGIVLFLVGMALRTEERRLEKLKKE